MQRIERDTIHRIADELTVKKYDPTATLSKSYGFSSWAFEFAKGNEELEQKLFDENDECTKSMYDIARKYGIEMCEEE